MREQPLSTQYIGHLYKSFLHYFATSFKKMHSAMAKVEVICREGGEERGEEKKGEERQPSAPPSAPSLVNSMETCS